MADCTLAGIWAGETPDNTASNTRLLSGETHPLGQLPGLTVPAGVLCLDLYRPPGTNCISAQGNRPRVGLLWRLKGGVPPSWYLQEGETPKPSWV